MSSEREVDEDGEDEDEEEDDEEEEEMNRVLTAEGEVLPELLGYYLERAEKESSREASQGVRGGGEASVRFGVFRSCRVGVFSWRKFRLIK